MVRELIVSVFCTALENQNKNTEADEWKLRGTNNSPLFVKPHQAPAYHLE